MTEYMSFLDVLVGCKYSKQCEFFRVRNRKRLLYLSSLTATLSYSQSISILKVVFSLQRNRSKLHLDLDHLIDSMLGYHIMDTVESAVWFNRH
jgi:hypothetical protein